MLRHIGRVIPMRVAEKAITGVCVSFDPLDLDDLRRPSTGAIEVGSPDTSYMTLRDTHYHCQAYERGTQ